MTQDNAPYRGDHDAALARADALECELRRVRRDLAAHEAAVVTRQPRQREVEARPPERDRLSTRKRVEILLVGVVSVLPLSPFVYLMAKDCAAEKAERQHALASIEGCVERLGPEIATQRASMPDRYAGTSPSTTPNLRRPIAIECTGYAAFLANDDTLPDDVRLTLRRWDEAEQALDQPLAKLSAYYHHRDWEEDEMRGARTIWKRLEPLLVERDAIVDEVRAALPVIKQAASED
jgi:hypothetical protein